jgi:hypothetical protein
MGKWGVDYADDFLEEVEGYPEKVQDKIAALAIVLEEFGPKLGRPRVDTLKGSKHPNMKELRFEIDKGAWRVAFAFDLERKAILLTGGNKSGVSEGRFYRELIRVADDRFDRHQARLKR